MLYSLHTRSVDATYNLALEQAIFEALPPGTEALWLWQNENAVIVGRHQHTTDEVRLEAAEAAGVQVVRRPSGGGAVYHDLGNVNFTYLTDLQAEGKPTMEALVRPVLAALSELGVEGRVAGRNDMCIGEAKFSGNAQWIRGNRILHHGTLLFDTQLARLGQLLTPAPEKLQRHAVQSVRARVTNIRPHLPQDMPVGAFIERLEACFQQMLQPHPLPMDAALLERAKTLQRERYQSWAWNVGASPRYTHRHTLRFTGGLITAYLEAPEGPIENAKLYGDFFSEGPIEELEARLSGVPWSREALTDALRGMTVSSYIRDLGNDDLIGLLLGES